MKDPGPLSALVVAVIVAVLYTEGGAFQAFAGLIILAVLITRIGGQPSILEGLLQQLNLLLSGAIHSGA